MYSKRLKLVSASIGASAVVAMGVFGVAFSTVSSAEPDTQAPVTPEATVGETVTTTTPPSSPPTSEATPSVTGTAPLPPEEQGLPG